MRNEESSEPKDPKLTEEERRKQVRERIKNSKTFIDRTQPGAGTAIIGGVERRSEDEDCS
jgi:hypothetical protein